MQLDLFNRVPDTLRLKLELFEAYYLCRSNKRNTNSALAFELNFESHLLTLADDIIRGTFNPDPCIAFIVRRPVQREVFAASFRDRVVHHWLVGKVNPLFEHLFVEDSYACRVGKGTLYGIQRVAQKMADGLKQNNGNFYALKLDVRGFFMHIQRTKLMQKLTRFLKSKYHGDDLGLVLEIAAALIFHKPEQNCIIQGRRSDWTGLPRDKSLFHSPPDCGLPIGNLTSQVLANFYLHSFDVFVRDELGIDCYGRYVDDFILMDKEPQKLKSLIPRIKLFLYDELGLTLHPRKVYFQHCNKGVLFLGAFVKPGRLLLGRRTKGRFYECLNQYNDMLQDLGNVSYPERWLAFRSSVNSYLGLMVHLKTFKLRRKMLEDVMHPEWKKVFKIRSDFGAISKKN